MRGNLERKGYWLGKHHSKETKRKMLYDFEKEAHAAHRRSIVANCDIPKGSTIKEEMIHFKRPGNGLPPKFEKFVIGKKTRAKIKKNEQITFDKIY